MCVYKLLMVIKHSKSSRNNDYIKNSDETCDFFPLTIPVPTYVYRTGKLLGQGLFKMVTLGPDAVPGHDDTVLKPPGDM